MAGLYPLGLICSIIFEQKESKPGFRGSTMWAKGPGDKAEIAKAESRNWHAPG
jgi:hypothetical protein